MEKKKNNNNKVLIYFLFVMLAAFVIVIVFPFLGGLSTSIKPNKAVEMGKQKQNENESNSKSQSYYDKNTQITFHFPSESWSSSESLKLDRETEKRYENSGIKDYSISPSHWYVSGITISPVMLLLGEKQGSNPQVVISYTQENFGRDLGPHVYVNRFSLKQPIQSTISGYLENLAKKYKRSNDFFGSPEPIKIEVVEQATSNKWGKEGVASLKITEFYSDPNLGSIDTLIYVFTEGDFMYEVGYSPSSFPVNDQELTNSAVEIIDSLEFN